MENPIKDNRIVSNITFARRFKSFVSNIQVNDAMSMEELDYMQRVAEQLLQHQIETCPKEEQAYHLNCDKELKF